MKLVKKKNYFYIKIFQTNILFFFFFLIKIIFFTNKNVNIEVLSPKQLFLYNSNWQRWIWKGYLVLKNKIYIINQIKVWKVEYLKNKQFYALKEMQKAKVINKKSVNSVMNERQLLSGLSHPFLINMLYAFQDRQSLYLVMDLLTGGDLRYHISSRRKFTEQQTKFFTACIIIGLEYLHSNGIIHRDIKPENIVFDSMGYLRITDLGIARIWKPDNSQDTSGTPGYMAPEVMCRQNHGVAVDYYALGIIVYECMIGKRPYVGKSRQEIRDQILAKQVQLKKSDVPEGWTLEAADFANRLIQRKPANRLGLNGPQEVKNHPWFKGFPWQKLLDKQLTPQFIPNIDQQNFISDNRNDSIDENCQQTQILLRRNSIQVFWILI
ncbi:protein kinase domain protein [Ichthyophthirius multifiliis]|uniref:non-specific serine/threonine protein kinase n=1 Tax=Ichthyophthirius multifiliis TaxID=5932 RepID=G0QP17_ICHMU|nr:protein kinase domain protein [Ichthyophthirius multifiliis]EGR33032.1 protein kinase domain protein [Ichthyophthirius multifiliis]|eukprot:XP_004037018.1 protein kinase domain protein [Ichthyophthirius multifiliis]